jgi:DNA-binding response OmpR family regulator
MCTVLLAEDDALVRRVVADILFAIGYHVIPVGSALEALQVSEPFGIAVLDGHLEHRLRSDLSAELRRRNPEVRIVVLTALREDGFPCADAVLPKPFSLDELRAALA